MKRNELLINIFTIILIILIAAIVYLALTDSRKGLTLFSARLEDRVSYRYLFKCVSETDALKQRSVRIGQSGYENGAANIVTAVIVDYRLFDTFCEVLILFAASAGVTLLMEKRKKRIKKEAGIIVQTAVPMIMLFTIVVAFYIILHGHLSPGGGFSGGALIASAFILQFIAFEKKLSKRWFALLEPLAGLGLLAFGLSGLYLRGSFFANFLPTGSLGATISAGGIMIVYALIGIKVASGLSSISADFSG